MAEPHQESSLGPSQEHLRWTVGAARYSASWPVLTRTGMVKREENLTQDSSREVFRAEESDTKLSQAVIPESLAGYQRITTGSFYSAGLLDSKQHRNPQMIPKFQ